LHGRNFTSYVFQAIVWKYKLKDNKLYTWSSDKRPFRLYSDEIISFFRKISKKNLDDSISEYKIYMKNKAKKSKNKVN